MADPQFNVSHGINLIVGAELFSILLLAEKISFNDNLPVLQKTTLQYKVPTSTPAQITCLVSILGSLVTQVKRFWKVEDFDHGKTFTAEEQLCEAQFAKTHTRNAEGRYVVRLPDRQEMVPLIGETWSMAARRLTAVEKRFRNENALHTSYVQFMDENQQLGHMEKIKTPVALPQFFLHHHAIHRLDSSTTNIRVVFNG
ncbi:uncharacterized protein LOC135707304 [Ochlerotatus camptorhynchus]|uniref:uncharacterized protein LOC135707304 n=1 Tax=Ochlerotatus camptorhynchus TaxID=644619 RepID=UPI0031D05428